MNVIASKAHGAHIVTQYGTTYTKLAGNDISSNLENILTHFDIWGASTLPQGKDPDKGKPRNAF